MRITKEQLRHLVKEVLQEQMVVDLRYGSPSAPEALAGQREDDNLNVWEQELKRAMPKVQFDKPFISKYAEAPGGWEWHAKMPQTGLLRYLADDLVFRVTRSTSGDWEMTLSPDDLNQNAIYGIGRSVDEAKDELMSNFEWFYNDLQENINNFFSK